MIKNIVFDMGMVLVDFDTHRFVNTHAQPADHELLLRNVFRSVEWIQMDRGSMTAQQAYGSICQRLPQRLHPVVARLLDSWYQDLPCYPAMEQLCARLKEAGYRIFLLSNAGAQFHSFRCNIGALRYFEGEFISADWGLLKPDAAIYRAFCQHFALTPAQCFFIDDLPINIEGALLTGMQGTVYHGDPALLEQQLKDAGVALQPAATTV